MNAIIIDGMGIAGAVKVNLKAQIDALRSGIHLAAVCIGADEGVRAFVALKKKAAQSVGITFSSYLLDESDMQGARDTLGFLAADENVHGIFVELPLPQGWERNHFLSLIPPGKDVDALTPASVVPSPAVRALQYVLVQHGIDVRGMHVAVIGHGFLVGEPVARWLRENGARVDVIDVDTPNPQSRAAEADLLISGVGTPGLITDAWVKQGGTVIDFGYARSRQATYAGDVDAVTVQKKAGLLSPVPRGMGPLVIAAVLENLVELVTRS